MEQSRRDFIINVLKLTAGVVITGVLGLLAACKDEKEQPPSITDDKTTQQPGLVPSPSDKAYLAVARGQIHF